MFKPKNLPATPFLVAILTLMAAFGPLSIDLYLPAFLKMEISLNASPTDIKRTLTTFLVGMCIGMMFYGSLSDKYGRRKLLLIGTFLYALTSIVAAYSHSVDQLIIARFFQAFGAGACIVVGRAIIRDVFKGKKVAVMMSVVQVILMIAPLAAPFIGVQLLKLFGSWRSLFWALAFFGGISFLSTLFFLPETYQIEEREEVSLWGTFANYFKILKKIDSLGAILACAFPSGYVFAYITGSSYLYQETYGLSEEMYSLLFGLNIVGVIASAFLNILLLRRFTTKALILFGLSWVFLASIYTLAFGNQSLLGYVTSIFLLMCVSGFISNNLVALIIELNYHQAGAAMALNTSSQFLIGAIVSLIVGYKQIFLVPTMAICGFLAFFSYLFLVLPQQKRSQKSVS